ncbi:MAG TPA: type II toxin-antitoxin system RelE/ParE family toxin [Longimicrobium sp.]
MLRITLTDEAKHEIRSLGGKAQARIGEKINYVQRLGWEEALKLELVKDLGSIVAGMFEIIIKGKGESYRALCFPTRDSEGRLVVVASAVAKSTVLGNARLKRHVRRAAERRAEWFKQHLEERP